jgi:predicted kinase
VQRLTEQRVRELLGRPLTLDALVDHELQRELAVAYLESSTTGAAGDRPT